jgi:cell division protein FtsB
VSSGKQRQGDARKRRGGPGFSGGVRLIQCLVALVVVLNVLLGYAIFSSSRGLAAYRLQGDEVARLEEARHKLMRDNQRLLAKIRSFKENPAARERLVKQELGWVRSNEMVIEFAAPAKR